eukprot:SAG31_NODE_1253_length_9089_cov_17.716765_10_plen_68_part_00
MTECKPHDMLREEVLVQSSANTIYLNTIYLNTIYLNTIYLCVFYAKNVASGAAVDFNLVSNIRKIFA